MKLKKPIDWAKVREKQLKSQRKAQEKQKAKLADPEWRKKQIEKKKAQQQKQFEKSKAKSAIKKTATKQTKRKSSRGLKGRTPTALENRMMDAIGKLPCVCCEQAGRINHRISLHHTAGRVSDFAHAKVLPLCAYHHDTPLTKEEQIKYPNVIPFHAKGSLGGKSAWEALYGTQEALLKKVYESIDEPRPWLSLDSSEHLI